MMASILSFLGGFQSYGIRHHLIDQQDPLHQMFIRSFELFLLSLDSMETAVRKTVGEHQWGKTAQRKGRSEKVVNDDIHKKIPVHSASEILLEIRMKSETGRDI